MAPIFYVLPMRLSSLRKLTDHGRAIIGEFFEWTTRNCLMNTIFETSPYLIQLPNLFVYYPGVDWRSTLASYCSIELSKHDLIWSTKCSCFLKYQELVLTSNNLRVSLILMEIVIHFPHCAEPNMLVECHLNTLAWWLQNRCSPYYQVCHILNRRKERWNVDHWKDQQRSKLADICCASTISYMYY